MNGRINIGGDTGTGLITMAICDFIYTGDRKGLEIVKFLEDDEGNSPPLNKMISMVLVQEGRLLTTGRRN